MNITLVVSLVLAAVVSPIEPTTTSIRDIEMAPRIAAPHPVPWIVGHKTVTDWSALIDATWGPGAPPDEQLETFDLFWENVDARFACFHDIDDHWLALRDQYRPEVAGGVSRGRFAGILGQLSLSLRESHTRARDYEVSTTFAGRGIPLLYVHALGFRSSDLGAAVTAYNDGTGLVYRATSNNPLGLEPGDVILGYDGRPWRECLAELLAAEMPVAGTWASSPAGWNHNWDAAVGANWHLFDTMDVRKYASGETVHLSTQEIDGYVGHVYGNEQMRVGVPFPDPFDNEVVTWDVIERNGQQIGYIYVHGWTGNAGLYFHEAIDDLTTNHDTAGLILDFRLNHGGNMFLSDEGLGLLFRDEVPTIEWFVRSDPSDHLALQCLEIWPGYVIDPDPVDRYYDQPIAVLTGPNCISSGDQVALRMTYHPTARVFGKTTATAFNSPESIAIGAGFQAYVATADCARLDALDVPLTHREFPVDEPVWLQPDDVAQERDTVVEAAVAWITSSVGVEDSSQPGEVTPTVATRFLGAQPNPFNPVTELVFALDRPASGELSIYDLTGRRVRSFTLQGLASGEHRVVWDGRSDTGTRLASGSYLVQLRIDGRVDSGRVTLAK